VPKEGEEKGEGGIISLEKKERKTVGTGALRYSLSGCAYREKKIRSASRKKKKKKADHCLPLKIAGEEKKGGKKRKKRPRYL